MQFPSILPDSFNFMTHPIDTLDRPLHDLRISVTDRCNLRCTYCMPEEIFGRDYAFLNQRELLTYEEITRLAKIFSACGVRKIRLTGGEPLIRKDLDRLVKYLSRLPCIDDIALTTNGLLLGQTAEGLHAAGLRRVTVSLDAVDDEIFKKMNGRGGEVKRVMEGIEVASATGLSVKINMVVERGVNEGQVLPMAHYAKENGYTLRFIEFMDVGNHNGWKMDAVYPAKQIVTDVEREFPLEPIEPNYRGEVAKRYRYTGTNVEIGIIASVTLPFCRDCTRARITADGQLYTCLFADKGKDLRTALREGKTDEDILMLLKSVWSSRAARYSELRTSNSENSIRPPKVEMSYIGG